MSSAITPLRHTRAAAISAVTVALAAAAHTFGGGFLPHPAVLLALGALITIPVAALTARKLSTPAMMATLGSGQVILHEVFVQLSPAGAMGMAAHHHGMATEGSPNMLAPAMLSVLMLGAHILATAATAVVLAKNEAALFVLMAWLRPLVRPPEAQRPPAVPSVRPAPMARHIPVLWRQLKIHPLRGPPLPHTFQP